MQKPDCRRVGVFTDTAHKIGNFLFIAKVALVVFFLKAEMRGRSRGLLEARSLVSQIRPATAVLRAGQKTPGKGLFLGPGANFAKGKVTDMHSLVHKYFSLLHSWIQAFDNQNMKEEKNCASRLTVLMWFGIKIDLQYKYLWSSFDFFLTLFRNIEKFWSQKWFVFKP